MSSGGRIHSLLLHFYSPSFRSRYGNEMTAALADENASSSVWGCLINDVDFARNGLVQRLGATVAGDIESGARWAATASLIVCIAWAMVSLTRSIAWYQWEPSSMRIVFIWSVVLLSATARLLLPGPWGRRVLLIGLFVTGWSTVVGFSGAAPIPAGYVGRLEVILRWQTLTIFLLLALGSWARPTTRRSGLVAVGSGVVLGILLALRVDAMMSDRQLGTGMYGRITTGPLLAQGEFLDLTRLDLVPAVGWWWLAIATVLSLVGWFRPRFAVAAIILTLPVIGVPILLRWAAGSSTAPHIESTVIAIALIVIIESAIALSINWRTTNEGANR